MMSSNFGPVVTPAGGIGKSLNMRTTPGVSLHSAPSPLRAIAQSIRSPASAHSTYKTLPTGAAMNPAGMMRGMKSMMMPTKFGGGGGVFKNLSKPMRDVNRFLGIHPDTSAAEADEVLGIGPRARAQYKKTQDEIWRQAMEIRRQNEMPPPSDPMGDIGNMAAGRFGSPDLSNIGRALPMLNKGYANGGRIQRFAVGGAPMPLPPSPATPSTNDQINQLLKSGALGQLMQQLQAQQQQQQQKRQQMMQMQQMQQQQQQQQQQMLEDDPPPTPPQGSPAPGYRDGGPIRFDEGGLGRATMADVHSPNMNWGRANRSSGEPIEPYMSNDNILGAGVGPVRPSVALDEWKHPEYQHRTIRPLNEDQQARVENQLTAPPGNPYDGQVDSRNLLRQIASGASMGISPNISGLVAGAMHPSKFGDAFSDTSAHERMAEDVFREKNPLTSLALSFPSISLPMGLGAISRFGTGLKGATKLGAVSGALGAPSVSEMPSEAVYNAATWHGQQRTVDKAGRMAKSLIGRFR